MNNRFDDEFEDEGFSEEFSDDLALPEETDYHPRDTNSYVEESKVNMAILHAAIDLSKLSWFWFFKSHSKRMQIISDTYYFLLDLVKDS